MTFTQIVKNELLQSNMKLQGCCKYALLSALIRTVGSLGTDSHGFTITFTVRNEELIHFIEKLIKEITNKNYPIQQKKSEFILFISDARQLLIDCGIMTMDRNLELSDGIADKFSQKECCARCYLLGLFLGSGMVKAPISENLDEEVKGGYHFELALYSFELALDTVNIFEEFGFDAKLSYRKEKQLVYFKDAESVSDILAFFGATRAVLAIQNTMAARSVRAEANRSSNCISANIDKSVSAAAIQLEAIEKIENTIGLDKLSEQLKETAILRKEHPEATLMELTSMHNNVSKSGVNHRLRMLIKLSKQNKE